MIKFVIPFPKTDSGVIALGTFDGVHIGHAAVIRRAVEIADALGTTATVWCFSAPPRALFDPSVKPLNTPDEKARLIASLGVGTLVMPDPSRELLAMRPRDFLDALYDNLHPRHVVVGFNFTYGKDAAGNADTLREYLRQKDIATTVIAPVEYDGVPVSSTLIRRLTEVGDAAGAAKLLGER